MNSYLDVFGARLKNGAQIGFANDTQERKAARIRDGLATGEITELLRRNGTITKTAGETPMSLIQTLHNQIRKQAERDFPGAVAVVESAIMKLVDDRVAKGSTRLDALQAVPLNEGRELCKLKEQLFYEARRRGSNAVQNDELSLAKSAYRDKRGEVYEEHAKAVRDGDHERAAALAKALK